jgi:hypothetical protein
LAEDYKEPVAERETNRILKSTLTDESRQEKGDTKTCLFCGFTYYFRPIRTRDHLGITRPFQTVRKREEVDMQWTKAVVSAGLQMSFIDNPEVRKVVLMTEECGQNYIRTKPGGVKEPTLSHHTFFTTNLIPKLDKLIDDKNMTKMREMTRDLAAASV